MVAEAQTYNGWINYKTWAVFTHIGNEPGLYHYVTGQSLPRRSWRNRP